jgi:putative ABC transport system permease protein
MRRRRSLDDLDEDIRDHLARETDENIARGMTPADARDAALRKFGNVALAKEDTRAVWIPVWFDQLLQDARYGLRMIRRTPGFSAVVMLTLALGIALTTAVFSVVNAVLVRPLSYPAADRLVWIATTDTHRSKDELVLSPDLAAWREQAQSLDRLAGFFVGGEPIDVGDEVVQARIAGVTDGFWDLAGVRPALGAVPRPGEEGIVLSHAFFERWFRGDPAVVGRSVALNGRPTAVTGVLPRGFRAQLPPPPAWSGIESGDVDFYRASIVRPPGPPGRTAAVQIFSAIGRLKPGVSLARARDELDAIRENTAKAFGPQSGTRRVRIVRYTDKLVGGARRSLLVLLAAVVLVLLIACANVANLLIARGSARQREVAIRTAVGAGHARMLRQFFVESLILAAIAGAAGVLAARSAIAIVVRLIPNAVPRLAETTIDGRVLAFAAATTVTTAIVCGFAPAFTLRRTSVHDVLKDGARTASASKGSLRARKLLVAAELALSVVLLVGAGLMVRSFWRITANPPGFTPERVLTMRMQFSGPRYRDNANRAAYVDELLRRARTAPGVEAAGVSSNTDGRMLLDIEGSPDVPRELRPNALVSVVSGGYADAIGMRVVKGRWIRDDEPGPVFVMNEALAGKYFAGQDPIGRRFRLPWINDQSFATVVGVVADLRYANLDEPSEPELFTDYRHARPFGLTVAMRMSGEPAQAAPAVRALLSGADRTQPIFDVKPLDVALADSIAPRRFNLLLLGTFAGSALLLALVGIYGVIVYSVAQRTHEIGVRMALGAERREVVRMIVQQGMTIAALGILAGIVAALAVTRVIASLLYEVTPTDPGTFAVVVGALAVTAFAACCGPALKAALVDPIVALRCE